MLRPVPAVRVTTKAELDAALTTADRITVEGDDELLSYAISKAASDPENRVSIETIERSMSIQDDTAFKELLEETLGPATKRVSPGTPSVPPPPPPAQSILTVDRLLGGRRVRLLAFIVLGGPLVFGLVVLPFLPEGVVLQSAPQSTLPSLPPPVPSDRSDFWASLPSLIWPLVAIVAIIALFLIARQAISSGSNITITWKVTEKVAGRVVITKVRERAPSKRAAA